MAIFKGAGVAIVTPFTASGEVNYEKLGELVEEQIAGGTDSIIVCGTTGESSTMNHEEHVEVVRFVCKATGKRIPVIAGTGSNSTREAIHLSEESQAAGADGLLIVTPYYNKATQNGLIAHYTAIAKAVNIPILMYNIPGRTGVAMAPKTVAALCCDVDNIVGIKEAGGNFPAIAEYMNLADGRIDLYSGNDNEIVPMLSLGGMGVISVLSNVAPKQTHDICEAYFNGDTARSCELQLKAIPLVNALFSEVNPIPVKAAMNLMGKAVGPMRMPLTKMEEQNQQILAGAMQKYGIL